MKCASYPEPSWVLRRWYLSHPLPLRSLNRSFSRIHRQALRYEADSCIASCTAIFTLQQFHVATTPLEFDLALNAKTQASSFSFSYIIHIRYHPSTSKPGSNLEFIPTIVPARSKRSPKLRTCPSPPPTFRSQTPHQTNLGSNSHGPHPIHVRTGPPFPDHPFPFPVPKPHHLPTTRPLTSAQ